MFPIIVYFNEYHDEIESIVQDGSESVKWKPKYQLKENTFCFEQPICQYVHQRMTPFGMSYNIPTIRTPGAAMTIMQYSLHI